MVIPGKGKNKFFNNYLTIKLIYLNRISNKNFRNTFKNDNYGSISFTVSFYQRIYSLNLLFNRMVKEIAASVFCLKVVRYAIYLWLPLYLKQEVN